MKLRNLVITVALLAALSVVAYVKNRPESAASADPRVGKALLDPETAAKAAGLVVADQGKTVELKLGADGSWRVASYYDMPADFEKIARFVQDLNESKVERFVTSNPERLGLLEFKDSRIELKDAQGKDIWEVTLGKTPESGNGRFIRFGEEPKAFFSGMHVWLDTDPKSWANTELVSLKPDEVARIDIGFGAGASLEVSRGKKDAPWEAAKPPAGQKLLPEKVSSVLTALTSLRFSDSSGVNDPQAAEAAKFLRTFKLTTFDGKTLTVALGRTPEVKKLKAPVADAKEALAPPAKGSDGKPEVKPIAPEFDTTPAGPVFASVSSSDPKAAINDLMKRRTFKVDDYTFTGLPQSADELFEAEKSK